MLDDRGLPRARWVRVIEYTVPDRVGNGTGQVITLLSTITSPDRSDDARAEELAAAYHQRWEEETSNDQPKPHLRGPGTVLRSRLPYLVYQEIWAYLIVHTRSAHSSRRRPPPRTSTRTGSPSPGHCA